MNDAAKAAARQYKREWRARNPDKVRQYNARYWEKKAQDAARKEAEKDAGRNDS